MKYVSTLNVAKNYGLWYRITDNFLRQLNLRTSLLILFQVSNERRYHET